MVHYIEPADLAEAEYDDLHPHTATTVAAQQCGREPDAYEVRCTDGNYEWRRPYRGELEVIMSTGRDRSGKPFEYRALYASVTPLSTVTPAEVGGLVERLQERATVMETLSPDFASACREAASLIQSQAARIAELEAGLLVARKWMPAGHRNGLTATENMERDAVDALLNGERKG